MSKGKNGKKSKNGKPKAIAAASLASLEAGEAMLAADRSATAATLLHEREVDKLERQHELTSQTAEDALRDELLKNRWVAEGALSKTFHDTITEVAKGSIDRTRDSAKYVQTAATAIAALYTAVLGLVFSVTDHPLPIRGIFAVLFLGLSIALATAFLAFVSKAKAPDLYPGGRSMGEMQLLRTGYLVKWINAGVRRRRGMIRAAVVSLAVGVGFVAAPFVATTRPAAIPEAPVAPTIPGQIDASIGAEAATLFSDQVEGYLDATAERNLAIEEAAADSRTAAEEDSEMNAAFGLAALLGLVLVVAIPWVYGKVRDDEG